MTPARACPCLPHDTLHGCGTLQGPLQQEGLPGTALGPPGPLAEGPLFFINDPVWNLIQLSQQTMDAEQMHNVRACRPARGPAQDEQGKHPQDVPWTRRVGLRVRHRPAGCTLLPSLGTWTKGARSTSSLAPSTPATTLALAKSTWGQPRGWGLGALPSYHRRPGVQASAEGNHADTSAAGGPGTSVSGHTCARPWGDK